jgi:hypothetical protein
VNPSVAFAKRNKSRLKSPATSSAVKNEEAAPADIEPVNKIFHIDQSLAIGNRLSDGPVRRRQKNEIFKQYGGELAENHFSLIGAD